MVTVNMVIYTETERVEAMEFNSTIFTVDPRAIDAEEPGIGINLNDDATNFEVDDEVPLDGKFVTGTGVLNDPDYPQELKAYLNTLPIARLNTEVIFIPE